MSQATKLTDSQKKSIHNFIDQWEKMARAYFWTPPSRASARRSYEKRQSDSIDITVDGIRYQGTIEVTCSCKNIYVSRELLVDGAVKRITALKKIVK